MAQLSHAIPISAPQRSQARFWLGMLISFHIVTCCLSLIYIADIYSALQVVMFNKASLYAAVLNVVPFVAVSALFVFSRFSYGYFLGFYFYTMVLGYLWLVEFSKFHYDHRSAAISAFASALAFFAPALFVVSPAKQTFILSARALDSLLSFIMILAVAIVAFGALHNFRLVGITDIYNFRNEIEFPGWLRYAIGVTSNALLPFAFACFALRGSRWRAAAVLLLLLLFYPITLSKLSLFAPFWLLFLMLLSTYFEARTSVVLSLFLPVLGGVILVYLFQSGVLRYDHISVYFGTVNFRMLAFSSAALDFYNDYFSTHSYTHFCQILFLKPFVDCPYTDPLSIVMSNAYHLGNMNASLFATEGVASVGLLLAPVSALACGLVISLGNRLSSGLPSKFILLSGGVLSQIVLNVPLATTLLTNGGALLFLLWYVTPRTMFDREVGSPAAQAH